MVFSSSSTNLPKKIRDKIKEVKQIEMDKARKKHQYDDGIGRTKHCNGGWILSSQQIRYLTSQPYFYNASAGSYLEMLFLQRFWIFLVNFIPPFIAPCLISALGLSINILATVLVLSSSSDFISDIPMSTIAYAAFSIFLYQTLDALDGKQASKVQDSQIEELMDHGCDVISTLSLSLSLCAIVKLGASPGLLVALIMILLIGFFVVHWTAHVTHTMVFQKIDVSEAQWALILVYTITCFTGQYIWDTPLAVLLGFLSNAQSNSFGILARLANISLNQIGAFFVIGFSLYSIHTHFLIISGQPTPLEELNVMIPRRKSFIYNPCVTLALLIILSSVNPSYHDYPLLYCLTYGLSISKSIIALVLANISRGDFEILDSSLLGPSLLAVNAAIGVVSPLTALLCGLIYSAMDTMRTLTYGFWDLKDALGCGIFILSEKSSKRFNHGFYINGTNTAEELKRWEEFKDSNLCQEVFVYE